MLLALLLALARVSRWYAGYAGQLNGSLVGRALQAQADCTFDSFLSRLTLRALQVSLQAGINTLVLTMHVMSCHLAS